MPEKKGLTVISVPGIVQKLKPLYNNNFDLEIVILEQYQVINGFHILLCRVTLPNLDNKLN